jgi:hypothetical protein
LIALCKYRWSALGQVSMWRSQDRLFCIGSPDCHERLESMRFRKIVVVG